MTQGLNELVLRKKRKKRPVEDLDYKRERETFTSKLPDSKWVGLLGDFYKGPYTTISGITVLNKTKFLSFFLVLLDPVQGTPEI